MKDKDFIEVVAHLRQNARITLTELSKRTGMPVSTIFDRMQHLEELGIRRFSALLDFSKLGFATRAVILLKAVKGRRAKLQEWLSSSAAVNSLMRINNGYDFIADCIFRSMQEVEQFCEQVEQAHGMRPKELHFIIEELKVEEFLASPKKAKGGKNE